MLAVISRAAKVVRSAAVKASGGCPKNGMAARQASTCIVRMKFSRLECLWAKQFKSAKPERVTDMVCCRLRGRNKRSEYGI